MSTSVPVGSNGAIGSCSGLEGIVLLEQYVGAVNEMDIQSGNRWESAATEIVPPPC